MANLRSGDLQDKGILDVQDKGIIDVQDKGILRSHLCPQHVFAQVGNRLKNISVSENLTPWKIFVGFSRGFPEAFLRICRGFYGIFPLRAGVAGSDAPATNLKVVT